MPEHLGFGRENGNRKIIYKHFKNLSLHPLKKNPHFCKVFVLSSSSFIFKTAVILSE